MPSIVAPFLVASLGMVAAWTVATFRNRRERHVYVTQWYILGAMFWMKIGFAIAVTFATVSTLMVYGKARREPKVARLLLSLGPLATLCYALTIVFAVLAFH